jgi:3-oxoadipate enol-lactonase
MPQDEYKDDLERGLANRRSVLGEAWVERSVANANAFNAEFQDLISRYAWHDIWSRPGLDWRTRRIIVLAICCALGRWDEFELHVRAAMSSQALTPDDIKEVLLQAAIYAGVPAANSGFTHAMKAMREAGISLEPAELMGVAHPGVGHIGRTSSAPALHYSVREARNGQPRATVVMSHALGCDASMWDALANALAGEYRVIAYDHRGHGRSAVPTGPYTMEQLADDAERLLVELDAGAVVWIGLSMGGMVGQELALRHPARVAGLVVANSTSAYPDMAKTAWRDRIDKVSKAGLESVADMVMGRYFSEAFRGEQPGRVAQFRRRLVTTDPQGYTACCAAVMDVDTRTRLAQIRCPVLVIAGELDQGTPLEMSSALAKACGAELAVIEGASHLSAVEAPARFEAVVRRFLP